MTNEEAIKQLKKCKSIHNGSYGEAIDLAIKALEQEPCEDCVSRKAIKEKKVYSKERHEYIVPVAEIDWLPSVKPKFTDEEILKMQELEQAQLDKAYELGRAEVQPCDDTISKKDVMAIIEWAYDKCQFDSYTDYCEIRDMVKELPSVTPKASKDCISRQAVIDIIDFEDKWLHDANGHNANTKIAFSGLRSRVKALSSVQPQRKRGKWKWELASNGWVNYICSECGFTKNTDIHVRINYQYCPKCGAEMRGESDD